MSQYFITVGAGNKAFRRNHAIDLLRALSVLYIVGYWHLFPYVAGFPGYANSFTEGIKAIVLGLFTFTSGCLLAGRPPRLDLAGIFSFYLCRLRRIYPIYALALLLFHWAGLASGMTILKGALLVSMFAPPVPPTLWFITMIMFFYLIAPVLIHFADRLLPYLAFCAATLTGFGAFSILINSMDFRMLMYFPAFALGVAVERLPGLRRRVDDARLVLAMLMIPTYFLFQSGNESTITGAMTLIPLILVGVLVLFAYAVRYTCDWQSPIIHFISYSSFCMYLLHRLVYKYAGKIYFPSEPMQQAVYLLVAGLGVTTVLSYLVQRAYDRGLAVLMQVSGNTEEQLGR